MLTDFRVAVRGLLRRPAFALTAVLTMALGIGATTAIYSVVRAVLLEPLPFERPDELVMVDVRGIEGNLISLSIPNYRDWAAKSRVFQSFSASAGWGLTETGAGPANLVRGEAVIGPFFSTIGFHPLLGRVFSPAETEPGSPPLVVLSHGFWQRRFGGDSAVVGRTMLLDDRAYTVVGILPPGAGFPSERTEIYVNMGSLPGLPFDDRGSSFGTRGIARLATGVTIADARADMARVHREIEADIGEPAATPLPRTMSDYYVGDVQGQLWALFAAVGFLLLIAVANVANLQLARGEERRRELAVRTALGAGRTLMLRLLVAENLVISLAGGVAGIAVAAFAVRAFLPLLPDAVPTIVRGRIGLDAGVLAFTILLTTLAGVLFGLVPAVRSLRLRPAEELTASGRTTTGRRAVSRGLVTVEVAMALILMIGAGLAVRSLVNLRAIDLGFAPEGVYSARISFPGSRYDTLPRWTGFQDRLLAQVRAAPGVRSAAMTLLIPLSGRSWERGAVAEGRELSRENAEHTLYNVVTPDYFRTLDVPILRGRGITAADVAGGVPVVVIDERMAERQWPGENPLGKRLTLFEQRDGMTGHGADTQPVYREVIGVTRNVRHYAVAEPSRPQAYVPATQAWPAVGTSMNIAIRTTGDPMRFAALVRREVAALDADVVVQSEQALQSYVDEDVGGTRFVGLLLSTFGAVAMALALVGVFGIVAYGVARRTRELGIRLALGGTPGLLIRTIVTDGLKMAGLGVAVGLGGSALLARFLGSVLYGVQPVDPVSYAVLAGVLLAAAAVAAWLPSRRVGRIDPMRVLSIE